MIEIGPFLLIFALGLVVSFFSGLLGIGGGIIMTPLLLYVPQLFGMEPLGMREVAGLTMVQGFVAAASGVVRHRRYGFVSKGLVLDMGLTIAFASFLGAVASQFVPPSFLLATFAALALIAGLLMLVPVKEATIASNMPLGIYNRPLALSIASIVGVLGGLVGQGGAFILIPLMIQGLKIPTRYAIGSSLGIVLFSAAAGLLGKLGTGQILIAFAFALVVGALPGAQLGAYVSRRTRPEALRQILALFITLSAIRIGYGIFG